MKLPVVAVYDANILYPAPLRDLFVRIAVAGLVQAKWTDEIHDEWIRNVLKDRGDLCADRLARTRRLMDAAARDCLVRWPRKLLETIHLPDANDRHVVAAAIASRARVIVTFNLKDFPRETLASFKLEAQHPDDFLSMLIQLVPTKICSIVSDQRASLRNPRRSVIELLNSLERSGLNKSVAQLGGLSHLL